MNLVQSFGKLLERYLNSSVSWEKSFNKSIGFVEKNSPWRESVYRHSSGWVIIHYENVKTPSMLSTMVPRHIWKISHNSSNDWEIRFQYGLASYIRKKKHE